MLRQGVGNPQNWRRTHGGLAKSRRPNSRIRTHGRGALPLALAAAERRGAKPSLEPAAYALPSRRISLSTALSVALSDAITMLGSMPTPCSERPAPSWIST